jgi:hypothetical protein
MTRLDKLEPAELLQIIQKEDRSAEFTANPPTKAEIKRASQIVSYAKNHMGEALVF